MKKLLYLPLLCLCACEGGSAKEIIYTDKAPAPIATYSQAVKAGNTLYVSGQIALYPDGRLDTGSIASECMQALNNIKAIVEAAGMELGDVSKCTIYLRDLKNFEEIDQIYGSYFPVNPPARETVQVEALPKGARIEISAIAVK
jgi:2-iminobutanoate/2-iminopropanoate deaminase